MAQMSSDQANLKILKSSSSSELIFTIYTSTEYVKDEQILQLWVWTDQMQNK